MWGLTVLVTASYAGQAVEEIRSARESREGTEGDLKQGYVDSRYKGQILATRLNPL